MFYFLFHFFRLRLFVVVVGFVIVDIDMALKSPFVVVDGQVFRKTRFRWRTGSSCSTVSDGPSSSILRAKLTNGSKIS